MDDSPEYLTEVKLTNTRTQEVFFNNLTYYYIELPKFTKQETELSNHLDYWLYYLRHLANSQSIPETLEQDHIIKEAFEIAEFLALPPKKQFRYQHELKIRLDNYNAALYAKELTEINAKKEEKTTIAMSLLDVLDMETIALKTGLSIAEVQALKASPD